MSTISLSKKVIAIISKHPVVVDCVRDTSCRFWNSVFEVCSAGRRVPEDTPCMIEAKKFCEEEKGGAK